MKIEDEERARVRFRPERLNESIKSQRLSTRSKAAYSEAQVGKSAAAGNRVATIHRSLRYDIDTMYVCTIILNTSYIELNYNSIINQSIKNQWGAILSPDDLSSAGLISSSFIKRGLNFHVQGMYKNIFKHLSFTALIFGVF